jgi:oligopeptide transport system substrate-binding protein
LLFALEIKLFCKNSKYWEEEVMAIQNLHVISGVNSDTEENVFIVGQLDITDNAPIHKIHFHQERTSRSIKSAGQFLLLVQLQRKSFDDIRVRKAFSLAIDRNATGTLLNFGAGFEAYALMPPRTMYYDNFEFIEDHIGCPESLRPPLYLAM